MTNIIENNVKERKMRIFKYLLGLSFCVMAFCETDGGNTVFGEDDGLPYVRNDFLVKSDKNNTAHSLGNGKKALKMHNTKAENDLKKSQRPVTNDKAVNK